MRLEFEVRDHLPPKKDGANSMWAKPAEVPRLIALRQKAHQSLQGRAPLRSKIKLSLTLRVPRADLVKVGDLDNFVTGVCDGLMAASPRARLARSWESPSLRPVHPRLPLAIEDDSEVVSIRATKKADPQGRLSYSVVLDGMP